MREVGVLEAKTHLSALLDEVEQGGELAITRHGRVVARLIGTLPAPMTRAQIAAEFERLRNDIEASHGASPDFDWKAAVEEGRE